MWPKDIRSDLRGGLLAKRKGDLDSAIAYLARYVGNYSTELLSLNLVYRAWETTLSTPITAFKDEPLLKTTGVAITLAGILEQSNRRNEAYEVYKDALRQMAAQGSQNPTTPAELTTDLLKTFTVSERIRAISIAYKLGELAHDLQKPLEEEEKWLVWSVEALLKTVMHGPEQQAKEVLNVSTRVDELGLPPSAMLHNFAAPFEALATFYSQRGRIRSVYRCG